MRWIFLVFLSLAAFKATQVPEQEEEQDTTEQLQLRARLLRLENHAGQQQPSALLQQLLPHIRSRDESMAMCVSQKLFKALDLIITYHGAFAPEAVSRLVNSKLLKFVLRCEDDEIWDRYFSQNRMDRVFDAHGHATPLYSREQRIGTFTYAALHKALFKALFDNQETQYNVEKFFDHVQNDKEFMNSMISEDILGGSYSVSVFFDFYRLNILGEIDSVTIYPKLLHFMSYVDEKFRRVMDSQIFIQALQEHLVAIKSGKASIDKLVGINLSSWNVAQEIKNQFINQLERFVKDFIMALVRREDASYTQYYDAEKLKKDLKILLGFITSGDPRLFYSPLHEIAHSLIDNALAPGKKTNASVLAATSLAIETILTLIYFDIPDQCFIGKRLSGPAFFIFVFHIPNLQVLCTVETFEELLVIPGISVYRKDFEDFEHLGFPINVEGTLQYALNQRPDPNFEAIGAFYMIFQHASLNFRIVTKDEFVDRKVEVSLVDYDGSSRRIEVRISNRGTPYTITHYLV